MNEKSRYNKLLYMKTVIFIMFELEEAIWNIKQDAKYAVHVSYRNS